MDSTRALFLLRMLHKQRKAVLMVGAEGTAKTSTALMFFCELDPVKTAVKRCGGIFRVCEPVHLSRFFPTGSFRDTLEAH